MTALDAAATVQAYVNAWNTDDDSVRSRLLDRSWSRNGTYIDPLVRLDGLNALRTYARAFGERWPGAKIVLTTPIATHNAMVCFGWQVAAENGQVLREGTDIGELAEDGRFRQLVGFFAA